MPYLKRQAPCPEPIDCKILTAALDLFVEKGYYNVSIHEIQKEAGVSIGSIYRHFNGKEGVAQALYKHILNEADELIDTAIEKHQNPFRQLEEIIKQFFGHVETHPQILAFIFHTKHTDFLPNEALMCDAAPFKKMEGIVNNITGISDQTELQITHSFILGSMIRVIQLRLDKQIKQPLIDNMDFFLEQTLNKLESQTIPCYETA